MATNNLQRYELMVIFTPVLAEDEFKTAQKKFADILTANGANLVHQDPIGLRNLAYPIGKKTTGLYWLVDYEAPSDANAKLELQMNRDETVIRHMITRQDKHAVTYNERRRSGVKNVAKKEDAENAEA